MRDHPARNSRMHINLTDREMADMRRLAVAWDMPAQAVGWVLISGMISMLRKEKPKWHGWRDNLAAAAMRGDPAPEAALRYSQRKQIERRKARAERGLEKPLEEMQAVLGVATKCR